MSCRALTILVLATAALVGQESRQTDASVLLDRVAATLPDPSAHRAAMLDAFEQFSDEAAYTFAAQRFFDALEGVGDGLVSRFEKLRDDGAAPGPKRQIAAAIVAGLHRRLGDARMADAAAARAGDVRAFRVIGPFGFDAESLAGFRFPPEDRVDFADVFDGYDGKVGWVRYEVAPGSDRGDPFEVLSPDRGAVYAFTQVFVSKERRLLLTLDVSGSAELFLDGRRALVIDRRSEILPRSRWVAATFPAGWHHVLVKTTQGGDGAFALTLRDETRAPVVVGGDAPDVVVAIDVLHAITTPARGDGADGAFVVRDARDVFENGRGRARDCVVAALWADFEVEEEALDLVEPYLAATDLSLGELWAAARVVDATSHLPENDQKARLLDLARRAAAIAPAFPPAVVTLARTEAANDRVEEGIGLLRKARMTHPRSVDLWAAEIDLLRGAGFESDRERTIAAARAACPDSREIEEEALGLLDQKRAVAAWIELASARLSRDRSDGFLAQRLGRRLLQARRLDELSSLLATQRRLHPFDEAFAFLEADGLRERGGEAGAHGVLASIARERPKDVAALQTLANDALARGDSTAAIPHLREALARDGDLHHVRKLLAEVEAASRPVDELAEFSVDTDRFLAEAPGADAYPDARVVMLLDQTILRIRADGSAIAETHQLQRLQDARGKDILGTVHADGDVRVVQTILPDGRRLVPNSVSRGAFEMAGLAPGVVVERRFRRDFDRFKGRPESFAGFSFQDTTLTQPFHVSRYVVIVPKALGLAPSVLRFPATVRTTERGGDLVYEFLMERVPRIQREAMMPRPEDLVPYVEFRRPDVWARVNRRYLDTYEIARRPTPQIRAAARRAVGDAAGAVERARRLYEFVMETIASTEGGGWPTQTLLEKSGDRFSLFLALLSAADVPHALAMGRAQEKVSPPIRWEMIDEEIFEFPLVRVEGEDGKPVYVSTQFRYVPFGDLRYDLCDAPVFVTSNEGGRIERTPPAPLSAAKSAELGMDLTLDAAGVANGTVRVTLPGWTGAWLKEQIERTDKKRLEQWGQGIVLGPIGRLAPRPKGSIRFENAASRSGPLVIEIDVEMKQLVRKTDGGATLGVPFAPLTLSRAFVDRKERKLPFVFHQYLVQDDVATITLDPAWKLDEVPPDFERTGPVGTYRLKRRLEGTRLTLRREVELLPAEVAPGDFGGVASFAKDVDEAENQKLTLRRDAE